MKKLLVLGAGKDQLPLIQTAKECGIYVIACAYNHEPPGAKLCDKYYEIDAGNRDAILKLARDEQIDGVIANTELLMDKVAFLSEKLDLVGNPEAAIRTLSVKTNLRRLQNQLGLFAPKHVILEDFSEVPQATADFTYPIIVKPGRCQGSFGVTIVPSKEDAEALAAAFHLSKKKSWNDSVILEEYVESAALEEVEAELFVNNGEILWDGLLLTLRNAKIPLIPATDVYPLPYGPDKIRRVKETLEQVFSAAGILHGEYNVELFFTKDDQLFLMEVNVRQGGDSIPDYVCKSTGVNLNKLLVTTAVGDNSYWDSLKTYQREYHYIAFHPLFPDADGTFLRLQIDEQLKPYITGVTLNVQPGDVVGCSENANSKIGAIELEFPDRQTQMELSPRLTELVQIVFQSSTP